MMVAGYQHSSFARVCFGPNAPPLSAAPTRWPRLICRLRWAQLDRGRRCCVAAAVSGVAILQRLGLDGLRAQDGLRRVEERRALAGPSRCSRRHGTGQRERAHLVRGVCGVNHDDNDDRNTFKKTTRRSGAAVGECSQTCGQHAWCAFAREVAHALSACRRGRGAHSPRWQCHHPPRCRRRRATRRTTSQS